MSFNRIDRSYGRSFGQSAKSGSRISATARRHPHGRALHALLALLAALVMCGIWLAATPAKAAFVTLHEAAMDDIFSQPSFGGDTVDIRYNPTIVHVAPSLLDIDSNANINQLFNLNLTPSNVVSMFFVDSISYCSGPGSNIIGCAQVGTSFFLANDMVVESQYASRTDFGPELLAHELAHNLGLGHVGFANLMQNVINGNTSLTPGQVDDILMSGLIQFDGAQRFVEITPILIAQAPIPAAGLLFVSGLFGLFWVRRRQRAAATA